MSFPTVTESGGTSASAASHTVTLPSYATGDLLIVSAVSLGSASGAWTWTFSGSTTAFTEMFLTGGQARYDARYRVMQSGDSATSITITPPGPATMVWVVHEVPAGTFQGGPESANVSDSFSTTGNPPNLAPSWGSADNLFIAVTTHKAVATFSGLPANYTTLGVRSIATAQVGAMGSAYRQLAASSDDPSAFTWSNTSYTTAATIAVRPAASVTGFLMLEDDSGSYELEDGSGGTLLEG